MFSQVVFLCLGLAMLVAGGELLLRGALAAARRLNISAALAGLVIVGFGTSMPELAVSLDAVLSDRPEVALGSVVGSNIGNLLFILGIAGLIHRLAAGGDDLKADATAMLIAAGVFMLLAADGRIGTPDALLMVGLLVAYLGISIFMDLRARSPGVHQGEGEESQFLPERPWLILLSLIAGLLLLVGGAQQTLSASIRLAELAGLSPVFVALTLVALGTSLPEITVSVVATVRGHYDVAVANVVGSNIFNILGILGICGLVSPLPIEGRLLAIDQWILLAATAATWLLIVLGIPIGRLVAGLLLLGYLAWVAATYIGMTG